MNVTNTRFRKMIKEKKGFFVPAALRFQSNHASWPRFFCTNERPFFFQILVLMVIFYFFFSPFCWFLLLLLFLLTQPMLRDCVCVTCLAPFITDDPLSAPIFSSSSHLMASLLLLLLRLAYYYYYNNTI